MNILIENPESLEFFVEEGLWSKKSAEAHHFTSTVHALRIAKQEPVGKFNIIGYFPTTWQFVNLNHGRGKGLAESVTDQPVAPVAE